MQNVADRTMHPHYQYLISLGMKLHEQQRDVRLLDYGCGAGEVVFALRERGVDAFGADAFYEGNTRQYHIPDAALGTIIREIPADGKLNFPADSFDHVISNQVFEHVTDLSVVLKEIHRVLKPGGELITLFPTADVIREGHIGVPLSHRLPRGSALRYWWTYTWRCCGYGYHKADKSIAQWTKDSLDWLDRFTFYRKNSEVRQQMAAQGFDVQNIEHEMVAFRLSLHRRLRHTAWLMNLRFMQAPARFAFTRLGGRVLKLRKLVQPVLQTKRAA